MTDAAAPVPRLDAHLPRLRGPVLFRALPLLVLLLPLALAVLLLAPLPATTEVPSISELRYQVHTSTTARGTAIRMPARTLEQLLARSARRFGLHALQVVPDQGGLTLRGWLTPVPWLAVGVPVTIRYDSLRAPIRPLEPDAVRVGWLPIPRQSMPPLLNRLLDHGAQTLGLPLADARAWLAVTGLSSPGGGMLELAVTAETDTLRALVSRTLRWALVQGDGVGPYAGDLAGLITQRRPSFPDLLSEAFALARQRTLAGEDPRHANARVLRDLGLLALDSRGAVLQFPDRFSIDRREPWPRLAGRFDLGRHLLVSAGLVAAQGDVVAQLAGEIKEVTDARGRSGFNLQDMAANRVGLELAELALADSNTALMLQGLMIEGVPEAALHGETIRSDIPASDAADQSLTSVERTGEHVQFRTPGRVAESQWTGGGGLLARLTSARMAAGSDRATITGGRIEAID